MHPFEAPREYVRALNATKLERVFAKPFLGALEGHTDSVHSIAKHPTSLSTLLSGSCDGQVRCNKGPVSPSKRVFSYSELKKKIAGL